MARHALLVGGQPPWLGVLYWCAAAVMRQACCAPLWLASPMGRDVPVSGPPPWFGVLCRCWASLDGQACCAGALRASMVGSAVLMRGQPLWLSVLCWFLARLYGRACVLVCRPPPWLGVLCLCVGRLPDRRCCVRVWHAAEVCCPLLVLYPPSWSGLPGWCFTASTACVLPAVPA